MAILIRFVLSYLVILTSDVGGTFVQVCQNAQDLAIGCTDGRVLLFQSVFFGRITSEICVDPSGYYTFTQCQLEDALGLLSSHCFAQTECNILGQDLTSILTNPCPGVPKYLLVEYQCIDPNGLVSIDTYSHQRVHISSLPHLGAIISPNYPEPYPSATYHRLEMAGVPGQRISFTILDVALEYSNVYQDCFDMVVLKPGKGNALAICQPPNKHTTVNVTFTTTDTYVFLSFESSQYYQDRGFLIQYEVFGPCTETLLPGAPQNGLVLDVVDNNVTYGCKPGFHMVPPSAFSLVCVGAMWSGEVGTCVKNQDTTSTQAMSPTTRSTTPTSTTPMSTTPTSTTPTPTTPTSTTPTSTTPTSTTPTSTTPTSTTPTSTTPTSTTPTSTTPTSTTPTSTTPTSTMSTVTTSTMPTSTSPTSKKKKVPTATLR